MPRTGAGSKYPSITSARAVRRKVETISQQGSPALTGGRSIGDETHSPALTTPESHRWVDDGRWGAMIELVCICIRRKGQSNHHSATSLTHPTTDLLRHIKKHPHCSTKRGPANWDPRSIHEGNGFDLSRLVEFSMDYAGLSRVRIQYILLIRLETLLRSYDTLVRNRGKCTHFRLRPLFVTTIFRTSCSPILFGTHTLVNKTQMRVAGLEKEYSRLEVYQAMRHVIRLRYQPIEIFIYFVPGPAQMARASGDIHAVSVNSLKT